MLFRFPVSFLTACAQLLMEALKSPVMVLSNFFSSSVFSPLSALDPLLSKGRMGSG